MTARAVGRARKGASAPRLPDDGDRRYAVGTKWLAGRCRMRLTLPVLLAAALLAASTSSARLASNRLAANKLAGKSFSGNIFTKDPDPIPGVDVYRHGI